MNLLILGATSGTGHHVLTQGLARGHQVTALVREPARLAVKHERLRVLTGDTTKDDSALADAVRGQDAVISTLGRGKTFKSDNLIAQSAPRIVRAMESQGVRRLVFTSGFGIGDTYRDTPLLPRIFIGTLLRDIYRDKTVGEVGIHASKLDWTIVYPTGLSDGPAIGKYRSGERLVLRGFPTISRADVADFLLNQLDDSRFVRKGVLVTS